MDIFTKQFIEKIAKDATEEILDNGLSDCTWREGNSSAYQELLAYRSDIEESIRFTLEKITL